MKDANYLQQVNFCIWVKTQLVCKVKLFFLKRLWHYWDFSLVIS